MYTSTNSNQKEMLNFVILFHFKEICIIKILLESQELYLVYGGRHSIPKNKYILMSVKIINVTIQLPPFSRKTEDIIPFVEAWLEGQESRFKRKVIKIFEGAGVEKRYSIMEPLEIFSNSNF